MTARLACGDKRGSIAVDYGNTGWQPLFQNVYGTRIRYEIAGGLRNTVTSLARPFRLRENISGLTSARRDCRTSPCCNPIVCIRNNVPVHAGELSDTIGNALCDGIFPGTGPSRIPPVPWVIPLLPERTALLFHQFALAIIESRSRYRGRYARSR